MPRIYQYNKTLRPYEGLAESVLTSNVIFLGDASMVNFSWVTSSGTASRLTLQGNMSDVTTFGLLDSTQWVDAKAVTAQGLHSLDTIPRWGRFQRTPSNSSNSIALTYFVGP